MVSLLELSVSLYLIFWLHNFYDFKPPEITRPESGYIYYFNKLRYWWLLKGQYSNYKTKSINNESHYDERKIKSTVKLVPFEDIPKECIYYYEPPNSVYYIFGGVDHKGKAQFHVVLKGFPYKYILNRCH